MAASVVIAIAMLSGCGESDKSSESSSTDTTASASDSTAGVVEVKVSAKDWEFDQKEIHVKKGDKVRITLAGDGHGLSLPVYNVNLRANDSAEFTADQAGQFEFRCSVPCGEGHMEMKGTLIVDA